MFAEKLRLFFRNLNPASDFTQHCFNADNVMANFEKIREGAGNQTFSLHPSAKVGADA